MSCTDRGLRRHRLHRAPRRRASGGPGRRVRCSPGAPRRSCARWPRGSAGSGGRSPTSHRETSMFDLVHRDDVLVSTVGPFARWGEPAVRAAVAVGARYLDSTGEPPFIRRVFTEFGAPAAPLGRGAPDGDGLRLRAGRAGRGARAARGGRGRRPRRRRLLRARRRAELDVARDARVARRHRARALLRLPRRRRAHRALGGADALLRREGQAAAGRSPSAAPSTSRSRRSSTTCARSTSTSAGSARSRAGSRRRRA